MAAIQKPTSRADFRIAIICALPREADAVTLLIDEFWDDDGDVFGRARGDTNTYVTGRLGIHNVVLAVLPAMGTSNAAVAAAGLRSSYSNLKLALIVGICGGVPRIKGNNAFLGDVIVSKTIIQYDYGRRYPGHFEVKKTVDDSLGRANKDIRGLLASFETEFGYERLKTKAAAHLKRLQEEAARKRRRADYDYPGMTRDKLFLPTYRHSHRDSCDTCCGGSINICEVAAKASCEEVGCSETNLVTRERTSTEGDYCPHISIGCLGSGNTVIKSGEDRDRIATQHDIIAFEMEGAGAWDEVPCIVVKGICDYSDSHKNKRWQDFAAATAAAVARALLEWYIRDNGHEAIHGNWKQEASVKATSEGQNQPTSVKFGKQNSGFQAGIINGPVSGLTFGGK
ncbi:phosphorylase superfamily protein [Pochonia chlamydosporia 170]|uniref:Phosphorylase superfamily protein n=1 Tax=Pochonia chlamydosporia 170 TaxID=1380566 RepID=A0A179G2W5_METCM|nr:phosphorylase superfamily protein [Pochonia chlamydosporia 170]OAQ72194.1 phosphorylase superfamily protein [Pochonia chlamydosporia 170]